MNMLRNMKRLVFAGLISVFGVIPTSNLWAATKITSLSFKGDSNPSQLMISGDGPITAEITPNERDSQVVVEIPDAEISEALTRKQDTSSFPGNLLMISPYQSKEDGKVRIILQLRKFAPVDLKSDDKNLVVSVPWDEDSVAEPSTLAVDDSGAEGASIGEDVPPASEGLAEDSAPASPEQQTEEQPGEEVARDNESRVSTGNTLVDFVESQKRRSYIGKPITLQLRDADVADIFRLIAEASGFNIIMADDVRGRLTLSLVDVPWDLALDTVFQSLKLGGKRNGNVLRVVTLANLAAESQEQLRARLAEEANAPRITKVFQVSYADPAGLVAILSAFTAAEATLASTAGSGIGTISGTPAGSMIQVDQRTNSIVIQDIGPRIEKMSKLIKILDTQTPQVMIEAKIIEATETFSKSMSGNLGIGGNGNNQFLAAFSSGNPVDPLLAGPGAVGTPIFTGATAATASAGGGTFGLSPQVTFLPGVNRLNAVLSMGESESFLKVIASPRTVVLNKQTATITQTQPVLVPVLIQTQNGSAPGVETQSAALSLTATPTVTNEGSVLLNLSLSRDVPQAMGTAGSGVANRQMTTQVLVESGSTLVIGGIYTMTSTFNSSGFPVLRKIPILGALFGSESEGTDRSELFFFITPRIINEREAGLVD